MSTYVQIIGDSQTKIWGMTGRERLVLMLEKIHDVKIISTQAELPPSTPIIFLRGDYIFDARILHTILNMNSRFVLYGHDHLVPIAISPNNYDINIFEHGQGLGSLTKIGVDDLVNPYNLRLKKYEPSRVWNIKPGNQDFLERGLFSSSYKGVTDLVTKWVWPLPARWATKACARFKLKPNHVTISSLILAILAGYAFWHGQFATGLLLGWLMTFLDTVDGKLARVTLTSSRFGDLLDHGLDLIHPPLWYIAWGVGLAVQPIWPLSLDALLALMFAGYIGGRLCEGAFQVWIAPFPIFMWQPVDSLTRLITARRNPNLLILTAGSIAGRPDVGLVLVIAWHLLSTLFLIIRLGQAWKTKLRQGSLMSWLGAINSESSYNKLAVKIFT